MTPVSKITKMIITPVTSNRTPLDTPKVFSIDVNKNRNIAAAHRPGGLALPPITDVPPTTTTAIDDSRKSSPRLSEAPPENEANITPHKPAKPPEKV